MSWTPQKIDIIRRQHANGCSAGIIALELGTSRNAVVSKARQIGITRWNSTTRAYGAPPGALGPKPRAQRQERKALEPPPIPTSIQERDKLLATIPHKLRHLQRAPAKKLSKAEMRQMLEQAWINTAAGVDSARSG